MNYLIEKEDVIAVIRSFMEINNGDQATESLILAIGAELLDISVDSMIKLI